MRFLSLSSFFFLLQRGGERVCERTKKKKKKNLRRSQKFIINGKRFDIQVHILDLLIAIKL